MSDFDPTPDPIDEAYVRAEALLADEAARAARRDRILAGVGREPAAAAFASRCSLCLFTGRWIGRPAPAEPKMRPVR